MGIGSDFGSHFVVFSGLNYEYAIVITFRGRSIIGGNSLFAVSLGPSHPQIVVVHCTPYSGIFILDQHLHTYVMFLPYFMSSFNRLCNLPFYTYSLLYAGHTL